MGAGMSDRFGLLIAEDGRTVSNYRPKYDSRRRSLILDLERNPKHMDIQTTQGGSSYTEAGQLGLVGSDVLYRVNHNLGFVPICEAFIYVTKYNGDPNDLRAGGYASDVYYLSGGAGTISDRFTWEADATEFRLVHYLDAYGFNTNYVSDAQKYEFRTKFYIYSIDSGRTSNSGYPYDHEGNAVNN